MTSTTVTLAEFWPLLLRRKRFLLLSGVATALVGFGASQIVPQAHTSEAGIVVETRPPGSQIVPPVEVDNIVATQEDVLRSRGVIEYVVQELHLARSPALLPDLRLPSVLLQGIANTVAYLSSLTADNSSGADDGTEAAIAYIQKHLMLKAEERSSVITARFSAATPEMSTNVLNAILATYISGGVKAVGNQVELLSKWAAERADAMANEAKDADKRVEDYVRSHNIPQVQGSPAASFQYVKDQEQLTAAQQRYARAQASLELVSRFGAQAAPETLESKTIQQYRASEARLLEKMATLTATDPRRGPLEHGLNSIRSQIAAETGNIAMLIRQKAAVAHAELQTIQQVVEADSARAQLSTSEDTVLANLKHDAETKRQVGIALRTSANDQARIAASQLPPARILFGARTLPGYNVGLFATVLGFVGGIVAAGATIILRRAFSARIRDTQAITAITGLRTIGSLPEITDAIWREPSPAGSLIAETLRAMSLTMLPAATWSGDSEPYLDRNGQAILVTSSDRDEGKTTVAATLARLMAADSFRVLLIDADLRRPRLATALHSDIGGTTLEAILHGHATLADVLHQEPVFGVHCVFAKARCSNPLGALGSRNFSEMLNEARKYFDFVILDSPPVLRVADALIVSRLADHVLFLVGAERVTTDLVAETIDRFAKEEHRKIHPVLTRVKPRDLERRDHYGGYIALTS